MSYCRWSSLNGYCDVYVYEDASGGWTTHVAGRRRPPGAPWDSTELIYDVVGGANNHPSWEVYTQNRKAAQLWHEQNEPVPIDLPEAGAIFNHPTPGECADNLERLAKVGFIVPLSAIEALRSEQAEMTTPPAATLTALRAQVETLREALAGLIDWFDTNGIEDSRLDEARAAVSRDDTSEVSDV